MIHLFVGAFALCFAISLLVFWGPVLFVFLPGAFALLFAFAVYGAIVARDGAVWAMLAGVVGCVVWQARWWRQSRQRFRGRT